MKGVHQGISQDTHRPIKWQIAAPSLKDVRNGAMTAQNFLEAIADLGRRTVERPRHEPPHRLEGGTHTAKRGP